MTHCREKRQDGYLPGASQCLKLLALIALASLPGCWVNEFVSLKEIHSRAEQAPYEPPVGVDVLSKAEIYEKIVGNTLAGPLMNYRVEAEASEFIRPDGLIKTSWNGKYSEGFWSVSGSLLCLYYPYTLLEYPPRPASLFHCYTLTLDGQTVSYYEQSGRAVIRRGKLLPGNAKNFHSGQ